MNDMLSEFVLLNDVVEGALSADLSLMLPPPSTRLNVAGARTVSVGFVISFLKAFIDANPFILERPFCVLRFADSMAGSTLAPPWRL